MKVFLFGIDGTPPGLLFEKWINDLPTIKKLMDQGLYAKLNSTIPPSTIAAWNSMISGKDTSEIGIFSYTYQDEKGQTKLVSSKNVKCDLLWDILGKNNKKTIALYVPLSYPVKPIKGIMVSDFLTPGINENCAYPPEIRALLEKQENPEIFFDVVQGLAGHKSLDIDTLLKRTYQMTEMQISVMKEILKKNDWDFCMAVMIGTDRLQHMLWQHFDLSHRRAVPNSPYENALKEYYIYLDKQLAEILRVLNENTVVIVASDHGMVKQEGKININNWLIKEGYLTLKKGPDLTKKRKFERGFVDFDRTLAYGGGAYNARIFLNKDKIPNPEHLIKELTEKLKAIPDDRGNKINTFVYQTKEIYKDVSSPDCPDLIVYFDDLRWASNPDLGLEGIYSWETAIGADSAGHSRQGCFIISGKGISPFGEIPEIDIRQVAPTILKILSVPLPPNISVKPIKVN